MDDGVRDNLRMAGRVAAEARVRGVALCREGASVLEIAEAIEAHMRSRGTPPAFPTCLSIDHIADRKSTRLNSSHSQISYAVFCLKKKKYKHTKILSDA